MTDPLLLPTLCILALPVLGLVVGLGMSIVIEIHERMRKNGQTR